MSTVHVHLSEKMWQDLVSLGQKEQTPPDGLLEQAVRRFLREKRDRLQAPKGLRESFGVWKDRDDLEYDSTVIVDKLRKEWDEREQRLGLA